MTISIITATYNSASTLRDTIGSVLSQRGVASEHIVVDGGSTDGTLGIVRENTHIGKWVSEPDEGIYDAMNKGIALAEGDIVGILNSDDTYPYDGILSKVVRTFEETGADAVYGDLVYTHPSAPARVVRTWKSGRYSPGLFKWGWMPPHPTFFVRREVYQRFGAFHVGLGTAADYELMLRLIHCHGIRLAYIPEVLVRMRSGGASNESLLARWRANRNDRKAWEVNGVKPHWFTMYMKPLRKVLQFMPR